MKSEGHQERIGGIFIAASRAVALIYTTFVCGASSSGAATFQALGPGTNYAYSVSGDGKVVAGDRYTAATSQAFRWNQAGGFQSLSFLPGGFTDHAYGISSDGSTILGNSSSSVYGGEAVRWVNGTVQALGI